MKKELLKSKAIYRAAVLFTVCLLSCCLRLDAQSLSLVRTDTDAGRSHFVTAGYLFGVEIAADSLDSCYRILFELEYNNISSIQYSGYRPVFPSTESKLIVNPQIDSLSMKGVIAVVSLLSESPENETYDNPHVIRCNFVVSQNAVHNTSSVFILKNIKAYVKRADLDTVISIEPDTVIYKIHGYVDVWPGDADNNGKVENLDFYKITSYLGQGSLIKGSKSFTRNPASTIWLAQQSLAWDSVGAQYSDCDGNGYITPEDMLVVLQNFKKTHSVIGTIMSVDYNAIEASEQIDSYDYSIPINVNYSGALKGVVGEIDLNGLPFGCNLVGVKPGDYFNCNDNIIFFQMDEVDGKAFFALGRQEQPFESSKDKNIAYLLFDGCLMQNIAINPIIKGVDYNGFFVDLYQTTEISEENNCNNSTLTAEFDGKEIKITDFNLNIESCQISIFDVTGRMIFSNEMEFNNQRNEIFLTCPNLTSGIYYLNFLSNNIRKVVPICVFK